ncbi:MAG: hypothetical protein RDU25_02755 [Patescibacteria group bacterium]|nr:hypothetical protein [Patescibacteria group bacterium]
MHLMDRRIKTDAGSTSTMVPILVAFTILLIGMIMFQRYINKQLLRSIDNISNLVCNNPIQTATSTAE